MCIHPWLFYFILFFFFFFFFKFESLNDFIFFLASLSLEAFVHLQQIFHSFQNGDLKDQKVPQTKSGVAKSTLDLKGGNFKCLCGLPLTTVTQMLLEVRSRKKAVSKRNCCRLPVYQRSIESPNCFLKCTNTSSWEEAETKYPKYACAEKPEPFKKIE